MFVICGSIYSAAVFIWLYEVEVQVEKQKAPSMRGEGVSEEMNLVQQKPRHLHRKTHFYIFAHWPGHTYLAAEMQGRVLENCAILLFLLPPP